jgi:diguanylate cyclase (GGDEF)-like protein/PAS domain S-box-containing protein
VGTFIVALFVAAVVLILTQLYYSQQSFHAKFLGFAGLLMVVVAVVTLKYNEMRVRRLSVESEKQRKLLEGVAEALRAAHKELNKTKKGLEILIDSSTDAIIATDRDGTVALFNTGAEAMLGYSKDEVIGQHVTVLYNSPEYAKGVMLQMRQSGGQVSALETLLKTKEGDLIPVLISASILFDEEGKESGSVGFSKDLRERKELEQKLENLATADAVTGLYNRTYFVSKLEEEFQRSVRYDLPLSLLILDIDYFKSVNDTFGHRAGDVYLKAVSEILAKEVRIVDTLARYGGEEMVVIMPHTKSSDAFVAAERLREKVASLEVFFEGHSMRRTVSIGLASYPEVPAAVTDDLLKVADSALYEAKGGGRNQSILKTRQEETRGRGS